MAEKTKAPQKRGERLRVNQREYNRMRSEVRTLRAQLARRSGLLEDGDPELPPLPADDERGHYPAVETARVIIARQLIRGRKAAGWTQAELAAKAGVRQETISRIETGKHSPDLRTMAKIDQALKKAGV
jgi:DNA-binding XRE family transcriptional regulator